MHQAHKQRAWEYGELFHQQQIISSVKALLLRLDILALHQIMIAPLAIKSDYLFQVYTLADDATADSIKCPRSHYLKSWC